MVSTYQLLIEAYAIAEGRSEVPAHREHLRALIELLEVVKTAHLECQAVMVEVLEFRAAAPVFEAV